MYCSRCICEFTGWTGQCPVCKGPLTLRQAYAMTATGRTLSYEELLDLVRQHSGRLQIELATTDIGQARKWEFPYQGYGFAWARRMQGTLDDIIVDLSTTEVGLEKKWQFPYQGYGYAWEKEMQGQVGGNAIALQAVEVAMEKKWSFPYFGFGFAWTRKLTGTCGRRLNADLSATDVGRDRKWCFPYRGYGFAWIDKAVLVLTMKE